MAGEGLFQNQRAPWLTTTPTAAGSVTHPPDSGDVRISIDPTTFVMRIHDSSTSDWPVAALSKFDATVAPGVSNDDSEGYSPGSKWVDVTNDEIYECADASTGAAVWKNTSAAAGGGDYTQTDEKVAPSGGSTDFDFTSIAGTGRHLVIVAMLRSEKAAAFDNSFCQVNGDTGANYDLQNDQGNISTAAAGQAIGSTSWQLGFNTPGSSATAGMMSYYRLTIPFYADTNIRKVVHLDSGEIIANTSGSLVTKNHIWGWRSAAAITRVRLYMAASDIAEYSKATLYIVD